MMCGYVNTGGSSHSHKWNYTILPGVLPEGDAK